MHLEDSYIASRKNILHAFVSAADLGGLEEKQAAAGAGMDPGSWSQFKNGERGVKPLKLNSYLDQCGNELPLAYWAWTRGYVLTPRETELEKRLRAECEKSDELAKENRLLRNLIQGRAA